MPNATNIARDAFSSTTMKKLFIPKGTLEKDNYQMFKSLKTLYVHRLNILNEDFKKLRLVVFCGAITIDDKKKIYQLFNNHPHARIIFRTELIQKIMMFNDMLPKDIVTLIFSQFLKENATQESIIEDGVLLRAGKADINGGVFKNTKVTSVGPHAFQNKDDIKEVILPNATEFAEGAFFLCSVKKVTAENLKKAEQGSLDYLRDSTAIEFPNLESVGTCIFANFSKMHTCSIPKVTYLPKLAFAWCYALETLIVHCSVNLHPLALNDCKNIKKIILHGEATAEDRRRLIQQLPEMYKNITIGSTIAPALPPRKKVALQTPIVAKMQESIEEDWFLMEGSQQAKSLCKQGFFQSDQGKTSERKIENAVVFSAKPQNK